MVSGPSWRVSTCSVECVTPKRSRSSCASSRRCACVSHPGADGHVRRDSWEAGGDLPHVQVVHLDHVVLRRQRPADLLRVEVARGRLEQHAPGLAQQPDARAQHQRGHHQRRDAIRAREAGDEHHGARDRGGDECEQIGEHVLESTLDVEAAPPRAGQQHRRGEVHGDTHQRDHEHHGAVGVRRVDQPVDRRHGDHQRERHECGAVQLRGQDLGAPEAEGEAASRGPLRQPRGEQRQRDRAGVGEHVRGIREECQRGREDARHDLGGHQAEDQRQRAGQAPGVVRLDVRVRVGVVVHGDGWGEHRCGAAVPVAARARAWTGSGTERPALRGSGPAGPGVPGSDSCRRW